MPPKKLIKIFFFLAFLGAVAWGLRSQVLGISSVSAAGLLDIDWGVPDGDPIFVVTNLFPGDTETRVVDVLNGDTVSRDLAVRGVPVSETLNFASVLTIEILENNTTPLYGPALLPQFFTDSLAPEGIPLSSRAPNTSTSYTFKVVFDPSAGNEYQTAKVVFDLILGISSSIPPQCQHLEFEGPPIFGSGDSDVINGTDGNDLIYALEGHDVVNGKKGHDCILGGPGHDSLHGQDGNDYIFGGADRDTLLGHAGNDYLDGESDNDHLNGGPGNDHLLGQDGDDDLFGGEGSDLLEAHAGNDSLFGNADDDSLDGGPGLSDSGTGGGGIDTCLNLESATSCEF